MDAVTLAAFTGARSIDMGVYITPCPLCQPADLPETGALGFHQEYDHVHIECRKCGAGPEKVLPTLALEPDECEVPARRTAEARADDLRMVMQDHARLADRWLDEAVQPAGTAGETYLRSRGAVGDLPPLVKFHPALPHPMTGHDLPAIVSMTSSPANPLRQFAVAVFLRPDGSGRSDERAPVFALGGANTHSVTFTADRGQDSWAFVDDPDAAAEAEAAELAAGGRPKRAGVLVTESLEDAVLARCAQRWARYDVRAGLSQAGLDRMALSPPCPDETGTQMLLAAGGEAAKRLHVRAFHLDWKVQAIDLASLRSERTRLEVA